MRTNFSRVTLDQVAASRLVEPWNRLAGWLGKAVAEFGAAGQPLPVSALARASSAAMIDRFAGCYELAGYSLTRAADLITMHVDRLQRDAGALAAQLPTLDAGVGRGRLGDLFAQVRTLIAAAAPILIDLSDAAAAVGGLDGSFTAGADRSVVTPFAVPLLGGRVACGSP